MAELVSCIIPVYNGERYLAQAIQSIIGQTYSSLEIIIIDDGSTDGTRDVTAGFGERIRYLHQRNSGGGSARNLGLRSTNGEFVAFLDADDLWLPEKLERQMKCLMARPELGYCVTYVQNFWGPEMEEERRRFANHRISRPLPGYVTQTMLARRETFRTVGEFNSALHHGDDTDWFLRARDCGIESEILNEVLVQRRMHNTNMSRSAEASWDEYLRILKSSLDRRRKMHHGPFARPRFLQDK